MEETFGKRLRALRLNAGLSQTSLAKDLKIGKSVISAWELGQSEPSLKSAAAVADYFSVSVDWLAGRDTKPPVSGGTSL